MPTPPAHFKPLSFDEHGFLLIYDGYDLQANLYPLKGTQAQVSLLCERGRRFE